MRRVEQVGRCSLVATAPTDREDERTLIVAEHLLENNRDDIARADGKVSSLVVGALAIAALTVGSASTHIVTASAPGRWLVSAGIVAWIAAIVILAVAVFPRVGTQQNIGVATYFGDLHRASNLTELRRYIEKAANDRLSWLLVQVSDTSRIVVAKYRYIRISLCLLALGGGLTGVGLAV
ncbi:MAG: DUF5706 domain-containing protein [Actinomycetota bacterium]|nr:DUF5706 domain-containing protein [Actinomycetota bacterium]